MTSIRLSELLSTARAEGRAVEAIEINLDDLLSLQDDLIASTDNIAVHVPTAQMPADGPPKHPPGAAMVFRGVPVYPMRGVERGAPRLIGG
jgi:hypothetical protein